MGLSAVLFVHGLTEATNFYAAVLGRDPISEASGDDWVAFSIGEGQLWLHAIPDALRESAARERPATLREETPIKLVLPIATASDVAGRITALGGQVITRPWGTDYADPEGNIFSVAQASGDEPAHTSDQIVPDTKNWTWVLERRCEDCGFDASAFTVSDTGSAIRDLSLRWQGVLAGADVTCRPSPGVWSLLEYACHVRDVFRIFGERLELMLTQEDPRFANWDQDRTAIEDDYAHQVPPVVAEQLSAAALALADRFDAVGPNQWGRRGFRSDGSVFTVESMARYLMHDPVHHLWDVKAAVPTYP